MTNLVSENLDTVPFGQALRQMVTDLDKDPSSTKLQILMQRFSRDPAGLITLWFNYLHKTPIIATPDLIYLLDLNRQNKVTPHAGLFTDLSNICRCHARLTDPAFEMLLTHVLTPPAGFSYTIDCRIESLFSLLSSTRFSLSHPALTNWLSGFWADPNLTDLRLATLLGQWAAPLLNQRDWSEPKYRPEHLSYLIFIDQDRPRRLLLKKVVPLLSPEELATLLQGLELAAPLSPTRSEDLKSMMPQLRPSLKKDPKLLAPWLASAAKPVREAAILACAKIKRPRPRR